MGRSQRHQLLEQNTTSAGEIHAQGAVAPGVAMQVNPSELNVMEPGTASPPVVATQDPKEEPPPEGWTVPGGPPGGPLAGSSMTGAIPDGLPPPTEWVTPTLTSISPNSAPIQSGDVLATLTGTGFTTNTGLVWNDADDTATFVSDTEMTTTIKTDLASVPSTCTVSVRTAAGLTSNQLTFELTEAAPEEPEEPPAGRSYPIGPSNIGLVTDHEDGLELGLIDAIDVQVGDTVTIEATGNTSVNGSYTVLSASPLVVDNDYELAAPIENKGRLTVTAGA